MKSPQCPLAFQQILKPYEPLFPFGPVGAGAVVQDLGHILSLPQVVWDAPVPGAVRALRASAGCVAVGIVVRVHPIGLVSSSHWLFLEKGKLTLTKLYIVTLMPKEKLSICNH